MESKLIMKSIKEVNESDLSENSTPVNSPAPQLMAVPCSSAMMMIPSPLATPNVTELTEVSEVTTSRSKSRPMLVKQKQSFHFPDPADEDEPVTVAAASCPVSQEETQGRLEGSGTLFSAVASFI